MNKQMTRLFTFLMVLCMVLSLAPMTSLAADTQPTYMKSGDLSMPEATKEDITLYWNAIPTTKDYFKTKPSVKAPYATGELEAGFLQTGLEYANFIRYAANLPAITLRDYDNEVAQYGAVLLAATNKLSHHPGQPDDMDDNFFGWADKGTGQSNLYTQTNGMAGNPLHNAVQGFMDDLGSSNLKALGHRRQILDPKLASTGFGYAVSEKAKDMVAMKINGVKTTNAVDYNFVSWPASGAFLSDIFSNEIPWSVSLNQVKYQAPDRNRISVTITSVHSGRTTTLDSSTSSDPSNYEYLVVNNENYGLTNAIIFRPSKAFQEKFYYGQYIVTIKGLHTRDWKETEISYVVDFFSLKNCIHDYLEVVKGYPATCAEPGLEDGLRCVDCGTKYNTQKETPRLYHRDANNDRVCDICGSNELCENHWIGNKFSSRPDCVSHGFSEGKYCMICWLATEGLELSDPLGHDFDGKFCTRCGVRDHSTIQSKPEATPTPTPTPTPEVTPAPTPVPTPTPEAGFGGSCGENLTWHFDKNALTLTISGTGAMDNFSSSKVGWNLFSNFVMVLVVEEGVSSIGDSAFKNAPMLTVVQLPSTLTSIGSNAFTSASPIATVSYNGSEAQFNKLFPKGKADQFPAETVFDFAVKTPEVTPEPTPEVTPTPDMQESPFVDVAATDWFFNPVMWAVNNNITGGIGNNCFGPMNSCNRAQVVTFLYAAAGKPEVKATSEPFEDVSETDWFYKPVLWAVENGITSGTDATHFSPDATCNRAAVVTFLYAAAGKPEVSAKSDFADVADTDWFAKPVIWAKQNDITGGVSPTEFGPLQDCNRAAVVTFLYKANQ